MEINKLQECSSPTMLFTCNINKFEDQENVRKVRAIFEWKYDKFETKNIMKIPEKLTKKYILD